MTGPVLSGLGSGSGRNEQFRIRSTHWRVHLSLQPVGESGGDAVSEGEEDLRKDER